MSLQIYHTNIRSQNMCVDIVRLKKEEDENQEDGNTRKDILKRNVPIRTRRNHVIQNKIYHKALY